MPRMRSISSTVCTLSAQLKNSNDGSASNSAASHASAAGSTIALASMIRPTPNDRASCTCHGVASVIPHAPASSCCAQTCGAIVVLPCGARRTPADRAQSAITDTFESSAAAVDGQQRRGHLVQGRLGAQEFADGLAPRLPGKALVLRTEHSLVERGHGVLVDHVRALPSPLRILQHTLRIVFDGASLQQTDSDRKHSREIDVISPTAARPARGHAWRRAAVLVARPGPLEDSATFERTAGGAEANVATVLAQLDVAAGWISRVGNDGFGRYLVRISPSRGVDVVGGRDRPRRPTGLYVKERGGGSGAATDLAEGESRMLYFRGGSAASALSPADLTAPAAKRLLDRVGARARHRNHHRAVGIGEPQLTDALVSMPRRGRLVSFDLNYRPALWASRSADATEVLARHAGTATSFSWAPTRHWRCSVPTTRRNCARCSPSPSI